MQLWQQLERVRNRAAILHIFPKVFFMIWCDGHFLQSSLHHKVSLHPQYCRSDFPHSFASSSRWNQHLGFFFFAIKISYQCYQKHWASCLAAQSNYWDTHQFFRSLYFSNILWSLVFLTYQQISLSLEPPLASFKKQRYLMSNPSALSHSICGLFCFGKVHFNEAEARGGIIVTAQLCEMYICCENLYLICCLWRLAVL